ncbi:hypothetical protein FHW16_001812 [Phyllobacterium myrsinacearum]|uniref:Uncharacterized protein n=1 Tax=Phyllobacterium myrsinacearum TaxID=28101 RepID=A0A839EN98_9HYPH|nr:hypothetical protein [Phyllobacterium myrsinacearum]
MPICAQSGALMLHQLIDMTFVRGSWFDKLTMRESGAAMLIGNIAECSPLQSSLSLMVSLPNHEPRTKEIAVNTSAASSSPEIQPKITKRPAMQTNGAYS